MLKSRHFRSLKFFLALTFFIQPVFSPSFSFGMGHDWNGESYSENKSIQFRGAMDQLGSFSFQSTEDILDIGSGDGEITSLISKKTKGTTIGMDVDPSMVSFANSHYKNTRLKFIYGNANEIEFKNQFSLITSFNTAQWIKDQLGFLQRVHTALKPDGKILFGLPTILPDEQIGTSLMVSIFKEVSSSEKWGIYLKDSYPSWL